MTDTNTSQPDPAPVHDEDAARDALLGAVVSYFPSILRALAGLAEGTVQIRTQSWGDPVQQRIWLEPRG